ncbi:MAG TPA: heparan-alpha-glucosaminide N-acetyltransferase domain-containing protein [Gemmataceae bacterium]|nr:heparan-alpha-glucosaminide N-acetyltransferase domain-containing protein [Gemmataceae bacterium]
MGSAPAGTGRSRLDSIDLLRGLVMVIMALDHTRGYFLNALGVNPVDLTQTNPALFLTRWITHYCAPTFVFLAGTGAFLYGSHGNTKRQLSWFLFSRGVWLVLLDLTVIHWAWSFNFDYHELGGGIIWVIGAAMVVMAGLVYLPTSAVTTLGIALVAFHNLADGKNAEAMHLPNWLWTIFHINGKFELPASIFAPDWLPEHLQIAKFGSAYALLPWLGVMASGYGLGAIFLSDRATRRRELLGLGIALTLLFVALRFSNAYGDPVPVPEKPTQEIKPGTQPGPWSKQDTTTNTVLSFINCQKYPPSLLYVLMTIGPGIILLALFDRDTGPIGRFFVVFGRVPLFFYLLHIPLIHGLAALLDYERFGRTVLLSNGQVFQNKHPEADWYTSVGYGVSLPLVYAIWIGIILILYPLCWWFAGVKRRHREGWLSYL